MSSSKTYQIPIVCRNGESILDMRAVRIKDSDEAVPQRLVLIPGDRLEFSIPAPGEDGAVGAFAIVVVLDETLVDKSHVRVRPGKTATISILDSEEEDEFGSDPGMLDLHVFSHVCEADQDNGLESVRRRNQIPVDPRRKKKKTTRPTNARTSGKSKSSSSRNSNARRKKRP